MMDTKQLLKYAWLFAFFTIGYNILEGFVSIVLGVDDESLALLGFGVDSFIEVLSGVGIAHMIFRIRNNPENNKDIFEGTALKITGVSFYILTAGLVISSIYNIWVSHRPITTLWGIVISGISIVVMFFLAYGKRKVGIQLDSPAILADAECTKVCIYMSIVLLIASVVYEVWKIPYIDSFGALGLAYYSFKEGKECFEKADHDKYCSCEH